MPRIKRCGASLTVAAFVAAAGGAGIAAAAAGVSYRGHTSQRQTVSFTISSRSVRNFAITIKDRCPRGRTLRVEDSYPTMRIKKGKFGGTFVPVHAHKGEKAILAGVVGSNQVAGQLKDASYNTRERALCHGSISFTATPH